jgi:glycosyltransferase involved in cell wall biosynthesis
VTLLAHPDSATPARLVPYGVRPHTGVRARATELAQVGTALLARPRLDVVHSFGRLAALLPILPRRRLAKLQSYQRDGVPWRSVAAAARISGRSIAFSGCSTSVYAGGPAGVGDWHTIFNGVDLAKYDATAAVAADAPLVFLGRIESIKGTHHAIRIAQGAGRRLVIAGNRVTQGPDAGYFEREVAPYVDGDQVSYIGPVDDAQKNALLGAAAAFLMPIEWDEPFGIVMAEALACGTPVIGFRRGSVPEVVRDGVNGFACATPEEAVALVPRAAALDRGAVREDCAARFGHRVLTGQYEALYRRLVARSRGPS